MAPRRRIENEQAPDEEHQSGGLYFNSENLSFIPSGCALLDCVLGGGWCEDRIINIVGDPSTNKTGLSIEACANFLRKHPNGHVWYNETEAAFDPAYAESLGLPVDDERFEFVLDCDTIEDLFAHLEECSKESDDDRPGLYIIDSLDAMTDQAERERKISEGSYGTGKAKKLSELFRRLNRQINRSSITVVFVSQTRENIGVSFGERYTRAGGKALRFYSSQEIWLSNLGKVKRTVKGVERPIGIQIRCLVKKLKVGMPFRQCDLDLIFGYGIDDLSSNIAWLKKVGRLEDTGMTEGQAKQLVAKRMQLDTDGSLARAVAKVDHTVRKVWPEIEEGFIPKRRKYDQC